MSTTRIEWADKSWNPVTGCSPVSRGCDHCYARRLACGRLRGRYGYPKEDPFRVTFHPKRLDEPLHWRKPCRIFTCSMSDLFHNDVYEGWYRQIWDIMEKCPQHTFILLTKRPGNIYWGGGIQGGWKPEDWPGNIWLGVTVEEQKYIHRIDTLLLFPAAVRFVSLEPLIGPVNIKPYLLRRGRWNKGLQWVIVGGETGPGARPMHPDWARDIRDQCKAANVPFFFKQMSKKAPIPKDLMIREFPKEST